VAGDLYHGICPAEISAIGKQQARFAKHVLTNQTKQLRRARRLQGAELESPPGKDGLQAAGRLAAQGAIAVVEQPTNGVSGCVCNFCHDRHYSNTRFPSTLYFPGNCRCNKQRQTDSSNIIVEPAKFRPKGPAGRAWGARAN
jgi:hypothetical protein